MTNAQINRLANNRNEDLKFSKEQLENVRWTFFEYIRNYMDEMRCSCRIKFIQFATLRVAAVAFAINGGIQKILDQAVRKLNITLIVHPILTNVPILYSLRTPEKLWFYWVFRGYNIGALAKNRLIWVLVFVEAWLIFLKF